MLSANFRQHRVILLAMLFTPGILLPFAFDFMLSLVLSLDVLAVSNRMVWNMLSTECRVRVVYYPYEELFVKLDNDDWNNPYYIRTMDKTDTNTLLSTTYWWCSMLYFERIYAWDTNSYFSFTFPTQCLTYWGLAVDICVSELGDHCLILLFIACSTQSQTQR